MRTGNRMSDVRRNSEGTISLPGDYLKQPWRPGKLRGTIWSYILALFFTGCSFALKFVLTETTGEHFPFVFFPFAVLLSAWFGGIGPGLLSTVLSAVATSYFFILPVRTMALGSTGFFQLMLYVLESLLFCWFVHLVYHDRLVLSEAKSALERELTERRRTDEALRESESRFRTMADQAPAIIWITGLDKGCTYVNRPFLHFTGQSTAEALGYGWMTLIHPDDYARVKNIYEVAFDARDDFEMEYRYRRADDEYRWLLSRGTPRYLPGGAFAGYIGSAIDVTERREVEQEIRKRARQNYIVARLGHAALAGQTLESLMASATRAVTEGLDVAYGLVLELQPGGDTLLVRSGFGLKDGLVGQATVPADHGSLAWYTLASSVPVIVEDLLSETRFNSPLFLFEHGAVSGLSTAIPGGEQPLGVLCVFSVNRRRFTREDGAFLQAIAHVLATAAERERSRRQLIASELRYRSLFNGASDMILVYHINADDMPGTYVEVNDVACRKLGYTREELLRMKPDQIADSAMINFPSVLTQLREAGTLMVESRHITKTGERIPMEVSAHLFEMDGRPTVLSICRDITERKRAESERAELLRKERQAREAAETAERRATFLARASEVLASSLDYEATIRSVADLIVPELADWCTVTLTGPEGELHELAVSRWDPKTLSRTREKTFTYKPDREAAHGVARVIRTGRTEYYRDVADDLLQRTSLKEAQVDVLKQMGLRSLIIVPLIARGATLGAMSLAWSGTNRRFAWADVCFAEDLARRAALAVDNARLYREAQEAERRAEEMARLKSAFLANMSHEIRTPLQGVLGFASLLARQATGKQHEYAERIMSSGRRLMDTLNAVLTLAKLEARQTDLTPELLDIDREVRDILHTFQRRAEERKLNLQYIAEPGIEGLMVQLDSGGLSSILHNIIGNAIKFTEQGGVTVRLGRDKHPETGEDCIRIRVKDTGIGISPEFLPHLFDTFQQESTGFSRSHEGSGLGLSITKRLVEMMGGTIEVESEKGKGSVFTITLPTCEGRGLPAESHEATGHQLDETRKARVLVIEDNPESRDLVSLLLGDACDVTTVETGEEAIAIAEQMDEDNAIPFDLVLLDVNLGPGLNGNDVVQALRRLPLFENTPIVALTAYALPGDRERFLEAGFTDYIGKPFTTDELLERTSLLLAR